MPADRAGVTITRDPQELPGEVIYHSARTRVTLVTGPDGAHTVHKRPLGADAGARLRNERDMLLRLDGVAGVPVLISDAGGEVLMFAAAPARPLTELPLPVETGFLLDLAHGLAETLATVHRRGVLHCDISPANVLVPLVDGRAEPGPPTLIDFELARSSADDRNAGDAATDLVGTLPYLAPEQTGRTGRPVDHRADLYALGAVLYELATGEPPFGRGGDNPLSMVHDHLARVPVPPVQRNPDMPSLLSDIVMRLLRKEPDERYQSGEGLAYDLARLRAAIRHGLTNAAFPLGARDFPLRLVPPDRLVGRESSFATLRALLAAAIAGERAMAMVTGPPGIGKTSLIEQLRPEVAAAGGLFLSGKYDQFRRGTEADVLAQVFSALGTTLLAGSDTEVAGLRSRLLAELGPNAGLAAAVLPPFALLLGVEPEWADQDPQRAAVRIRQVVATLLRTIVSAERPLVLFLDDLQWAGPVTFGVLDSMIDDVDVPGLLALGSYRETEVDETHPLAAIISRLRRVSGGEAELRLHPLTTEEMAALLAQMLRIPPADAAPLAEVLATRSGGNPFDTVELVNALRRESALVPDGDGWHWDAGVLRRFVSSGDVVDLLSTRIEALPEHTRHLVEAMAGLGGELDVDLLAVAFGRPAAAIEGLLTPAVEDGLVTVHRGETVQVSFRHDRVQQAAYGRSVGTARSRLDHDLARRLATDPQYVMFAGQLYLSAASEVTDPAERQRAAGLLRQTAAAARLVAAYQLAESALATAQRLLVDSDPDYWAVRAEWHNALCAVGRFAEVDEVFAALDASEPDPVAFAPVACMQIVALTNRGRAADALALGLRVLASLGVDVPRPDAMAAEIGAGIEVLYGWLDGAADSDLSRPELTDPRLLAAAQVTNRMTPPAYFVDHTVLAWLVLRTVGVWVRSGVAADLIGPMAHVAFVMIGARGDYLAGYRAVRRVLAIAESRGYEPEAAHARFMHALGSIFWFEPAEHGVITAREARAGLLRGGDLQNAASTYYASLPPLLETSQNLDDLLAEVTTALELCARTGFEYGAGTFVVFRQLVRALRGETVAPGSLSDGGFDPAAHEAMVAGNGAAVSGLHMACAMTAAIFGETDTLIRHAAVVVAMMPNFTALYTNVSGHLLGLLAAGHLARRAEGDERDAALEAMDRSLAFLRERAGDHPGNFRHLVHLGEAERAWATGDIAAAVRAFDAAVYDSSAAQRPWHAALTAERSGLFSLENGMEHAGRRSLAEAFTAYASWGAHGKTRQMALAHPFLADVTAVAALPVADGLTSIGHSMNVRTESIDLVAVLGAARLLSSETDLDRLRLKVEDLLGSMTGATSVRVVLWDGNAGEWMLPADVAARRPALSLAEAADRGLLPLSAFRYCERTRQPLVIDDVSRDDRVARDPFLAGAEHCSLLVVPVLNQGEPRAMLLLENRLARRAFSVSRLDAVLLIAGQLTVSLENALLYASLERKVAERTEALAEANQRLSELAVTDSLTGLPNRRRLTETLDQVWNHGARSGLPVGLAMIDIDSFKRYNDHYGHQGGDECLRLVAQALQASVRNTDLVARYGGEEFSIVLPDTDPGNAAEVAERARRAVADLCLPHAESDLGIVTISVGVTSAVPGLASRPDHLIKIADEALYQAKKTGRNRVVVS
jgi:diguanylate cyclase (GGDEF)-like protein